MKSSGIGGQAVIEGIMMRNKNVYSIAVRKPDKEIEVIKKEGKALTEKYKILSLPIIRGIYNFIDALVIGMSTITYSSSFYDDPKEQEPTHVDNVAKAIFKEKLDSVVMAITILVSIMLAIGLFMLIPYYASRMLSKFIVSSWVLNLIEGLLRVIIFVAYIFLISLMKDIKRVFMYHGAEHKCINCIENGKELSIKNIRKSSRYHKRCGTSFMFFVVFISVIFFIFIRVENTFLQVGIRLILVPVIAGVSYELIRWAGKSESQFVNAISKPGMWLQKLTTREPDDDMIEVAIKAIEEVFDWKEFLSSYEYTDNEKTAMLEQDDDSEDTLSQNDEIQAEDVIPQEYATAQEIENLQENVGVEEYEDDGDDGIEMLDDFADENDDTDADIEYTDEYEDTQDENTESEEDDEEDDGIKFIDDDDEDLDDYTTEVPIFKQRKTDI